MKETHSNLSKQTYELVDINRSGINSQVSYKLNGMMKYYLRHELLLVDEE